MGTLKGKDGKGTTDSSKYARYTSEQVAVLERVYGDSPKPNSSRRQQLIKEHPILANIGPKQLKVWFQNRRCREKQRKETSRLLTWNSKLNAMNHILLEENERLHKQTAQLNTENQYLQQQLQLQRSNAELNQPSSQQVMIVTTDTSSESVVTSGQQHHQNGNISQLSTIAEKTLMEFLTKATGSMVDWIQMPGMKPGPDSIGVVAISHACGGIAARTCGLVGLEPIKVAAIIKNRPSWLRDCRRVDILATFNTDHGGLVELIHTQMYAPTTLAPPWDFCTLRYTCCLEDGSLVICERSLAAAQGEQAIPIVPGFVRAEILPCGYLIRPCESGGSLVLVVDHVQFKAGSIPDILRPLYESSTSIVQKLTLQVLHHLRCLAKETTGEGATENYQATSSHGFSHRLIRGFNDAVNCFPDDGWISVMSEGPSTVSVCVNPSSSKQIKQFNSFNSVSPAGGGIICAKASMLLQGISPALLVRFLHGNRGAWMELETESHEVSRMNTNGASSFAGGNASSVHVLLSTVGQDELLEVVRLEQISKDSNGGQRETFSLQLCSGINGTAGGACAQLVFAPIDASVPDTVALLPSGFRVSHLNGSMDVPGLSQTLDLASALEGGSQNCRLTCDTPNLSTQFQSVLTMAFQFIYEANMRDVMALKAQQYVQALSGFVHRASILLSPHPA